MQNYFTWRKEVIEAAKGIGVSRKTIEGQQSEDYQHMYFDEMLTPQQAAEHLNDLEVPPGK